MRGNGRVYLRGRIWWIAYYDSGREYRESSKSRRHKEAVRLLRQRVGELAMGLVQVPAPKRPRTRALSMQHLFDLAEQHYRLGNYASPSNLIYLKRLRRRFGRYKVSACTSLAIGNYMAARQRSGRTAETINREMDVLRTAFRLALQHDLMERKPYIKRLPQHGVRNEFFTREEVDSLLPCLPDHLRDVVLFAFITGWRKGEILGLEWRNVSRSEGVIRLDPSQDKSREVRVLALHGELSALIERRWRARTVGQTLATYVFHRRGRRLVEFRPAWPDACREAGLGHRLFHSLRRGAARAMSLEGIPEKVIMSIMGHKTRGMFDRYNIVTEADQRAWSQRLFGRKHGQ